MPTYVYKFLETGETVEVRQSFHDDALTEYAHPESGAVMAVKKVIQPVGVTFKGSGFFKTDQRASSGGGSSTTPGSTSSSDSSDSSGSSGGSSDTGSGSSSGSSNSSGSSSGSGGTSSGSDSAAG